MPSRWYDIDERKTEEEEKMTKTEAIREVNTVSSGTLGRLIGTTRYDDIDRFLTKLTQAIEEEKIDISTCKHWGEILEVYLKQG